MIAPEAADAGEDDNSTEKEGEDSHLHENQKAPTAGTSDAGDEKNKTQDLAKAGRDDLDPNAGAD